MLILPMMIAKACLPAGREAIHHGKTSFQTLLRLG
jgi:hypothetical protein